MPNSEKLFFVRNLFMMVNGEKLIAYTVDHFFFEEKQ